MEIVTVDEAVKDWDRLIGRVETGEEILVAREGRLIARFVPVASASDSPQLHEAPTEDAGD